MAKEKKSSQGLSLIAGCISRSKQIIILRAALKSNRETQFSLNRIPPRLPSQGSLKELETEIINRIDEYERDIAKYLMQIVALSKKDITVNYGDDEDNPKFFFSSKELKDRCVFFHKNPHSSWVEGVLVLSKLRDHKKGDIEIEPGMIFDFKEITPYLTRLDSVIKGELTLAHAIRKLNKDGKK